MNEFSNPDRGGYRVLTTAFVIQAIIIGSMFAYGVFFSALESDLGWSRTLLSASTTVSFLMMGMGGIIAGRLCDRFGPRWVMTVATCVFALGLGSLSQVGVPWQLFMFYGVMVGVGLAVHDVVTLSTLARWFPDRRGAVTGIAKVGTAVGQIAIPLIATWLIARFGWRNASISLGVGGGMILLLAAQLLTLPRSSGAPSTKQRDGAELLSFRQIAGTVAFRKLCAAQFLFFPTLITIPVHIVVHGRDLGLSAAQAAGVLSAIGAVSILGRLFVGFSVDRIGGRRAMLVCFALLFLSLLWLVIADHGWMLLIFALIYGFAHGGFFTVVSPTVAEFFGMRAHATTFGAIVFFGTIGGAFGPLLAGWVFDRYGSYAPAFLTLAAMALCGSVLAWSLRPVSHHPTLGLSK